MNSLKEGLQILIAVLVLGMVLFGLWYLFVYMPEKFSEPSGTLVQVPGKLWLL